MQCSFYQSCVFLNTAMRIQLCSSQKRAPTIVFHFVSLALTFWSNTHIETNIEVFMKNRNGEKVDFALVP